jgi:hypothetical protein
MNANKVKNEIKHILQGTSEDSNCNLIQTIANYLRKSQTTSGVAESNKHNKTEETERLIRFINEQGLWNCNLIAD